MGAGSNHRGEPVTLLEGRRTSRGRSPWRDRWARPAAPAACAPAAPAGHQRRPRLWARTTTWAGNATRRGLRGHLTALARGEVSTGAVKVIGLAACGLVAGALLHPGPAGGAGPPGSVDVGRAPGRLIAGTANLVNLLDLRPGRALKAVLALGVPDRPPRGGEPAVAGRRRTGSALAALPADLGERAMLGDTGANAAGALLGVALGRPAGRAGPAARRWPRSPA